MNIMKQMIIPSLLLLLLSLSLTSCQGLIMFTYGMNKNKLYTNDQIERYERKFAIPLEASYRLDTTYIALIRSVENTQARSYHYQPLQVFYFDQNDSLVSYYVNCNTGGIPNLKWNLLDEEKNKSLEQFPPPTQTLLNTPIGYKELIQTIKSTAHTKAIPENGYKVIVFWNVFMGRQSKRLIQEIQQNIKRASKPVKVYYVNNDIFSW